MAVIRGRVQIRESNSRRGVSGAGLWIRDQGSLQGIYSREQKPNGPGPWAGGRIGPLLLMIPVSCLFSRCCFLSWLGFCFFLASPSRSCDISFYCVPWEKEERFVTLYGASLLVYVSPASVWRGMGIGIGFAWGVPVRSSFASQRVVWRHCWPSLSLMVEWYFYLRCGSSGWLRLRGLVRCLSPGLADLVYWSSFIYFYMGLTVQQGTVSRTVC